MFWGDTPLILQEIIMASLIREVFDRCYIADQENFPRDRNSILQSIVAEVGELSEEVSIAEGTSYKNSGPDGIVGEAVDVIVSALDLIYRERPGIGADEITAMAVEKCEKWIESMQKHSKKQNPKT